MPRFKAGQWLKNKYTGIEVRNKTIGINRSRQYRFAVARRAQGMEMKVIAFDPFVSAERAKQLMVTMVSLDGIVQKKLRFYHDPYAAECYLQKEHHY